MQYTQRSTKKELCILYTNAEQLLNKRGELKLLVHNVKADMICTTKVCPKQNIAIQDSEIHIPYYEVAASNLQECSRGCIIYAETGCEYQ
jgi:hypothetical protein